MYMYISNAYIYMHLYICISMFIYLVDICIYKYEEFFMLIYLNIHVR